MARKRPIPSTHGEYLAGEDGSIWRRGHWSPSRGWMPQKRIKPRIRSARERRGCAERPSVHLTVNGVSATRYVHRLVAEAWLPGWHPLYEVHHVNGDPMDNRASNLLLVNRADHEALHGKDVPEFDRVNCQIDLERRMTTYDAEDQFSDARRARARADRAASRAIKGSAQSRQIAQMVQRARSLARELEAAKRKSRAINRLKRKGN